MLKGWKRKRAHDERKEQRLDDDLDGLAKPPLFACFLRWPRSSASPVSVGMVAAVHRARR